jgi:hypothetical protein
MFPCSYFPARYFPMNYFPGTGEEIVIGVVPGVFGPLFGEDIVSGWFE